MPLTVYTVLCYFQFCNHFAEETRTGCFTLVIAAFHLFLAVLLVFDVIVAFPGPNHLLFSDNLEMLVLLISLLYHSN